MNNLMNSGKLTSLIGAIGKRVASTRESIHNAAIQCIGYASIHGDMSAYCFGPNCAAVKPSIFLASSKMGVKLSNTAFMYLRFAPKSARGIKSR